MLQQSNRLRKTKDIERVYKKGESFFSKIVGVKTLKNNLANSRFTVVAGLKISKKATKRNLVKRRLREILRLNLKKIKSGYDVMIITRPGILDLKYDELEREIFTVLRKLNLLM